MQRVCGVVCVVSGCLIGALAGCNGGGGGPTMLETRAQPYVADLPVPKGFSLKERDSEHYASETRRDIRHVYVGRADPIAVKNFYVRHMPAAEWEYLDETLQNGVHLLNYRKGEEHCEIRIERTPAALFGEVTKIQATLETRRD